jgi:hypothetical protein
MGLTTDDEVPMMKLIFLDDCGWVGKMFVFLICERFLSQNYQKYLTFNRSNPTKISKYPQEPQYLRG